MTILAELVLVSITNDSRDADVALIMTTTIGIQSFWRRKSSQFFSETIWTSSLYIVRARDVLRMLTDSQICHSVS